jgi:hypothetical protein
MVRRMKSPRTAALAVLAALAAVWPASPAAAAKPPNPCLDAAMRARLWCPDLVMKKPFGLYVDPLARPGRLVLRAGNSIDNVGLGPAELHGVRTGPYRMRGRQRIYRRAGGRIGIATGARLYFKHIAGQGRYWKFLHAARFELWRLDSTGRRVRRVKTGPKVSYCLRDLKHTRPRRRRSPRRFVYPGCDRSAATLRVTLGTSVGWSDVYPPTYPEQWIDVTRLRGCFAFRHIADPLNGLYESNERNNVATVTVRLPYRPGRQRCPGARAPAPAPTEPAPETGGGTVPGY